MVDSAEAPHLSQLQTVLSTDPETKGFDLLSGKRWIYPENFPIRDYQYKIVEAALYKNTLVCLPTGLGKTFIAAVVMYNFWRWYPRGKVIFMAPTKPLVNQQITACQNIMGITSSEYVELTGNIHQKNRLEAWVKKRLIFATPQIFHKDLEKEMICTESIKCIVIDEAHKALGKYAYCESIRILRQSNENFRILALSATPGNKPDKVQEVVQNLFISHLELRTDSSPDIVPYVNEREIVTLLIPLNKQFMEFKEQYILVMDPHLKRLVGYNVIKSGSAQDITKGRIYNLQKQYQSFEMKGPNHSNIMNELNIMMTMSHGYELMVRNGLRAFHNFYQNHSDKYWFNSEARLHALLEKVANYLGPFPEILPMPDGSVEDIPADIVFGHPKFDKTRELLSSHFRNAEKENKPSRAIVFVEYRDSAKEIYMLLLQLRPLVRPQIFVGQADQRQKQQLQALTDFKDNKVNVLISTSVGEEGLDVGEVDLIVCFDVSSNSPTRLVQRMGRTGRKRDGKIVILVTPGKEYQVLSTMMKERNTMNDKVLASPMIISSLYQNSPRMIPQNLYPECHKVSFVTKPGSPTIPKKRGKKAAVEKKKPEPKPRAKVNVLDLLNAKKPNNQFTMQKYFKRPQFDPNNLDDFAIPAAQCVDRKNENEKISPFNVKLLLDDNLGDKFLTLCAMKDSESMNETEENIPMEDDVICSSPEEDVFANYKPLDLAILDRLDTIFSDENVDEFCRIYGLNEKNNLEVLDVTENYDIPGNNDDCSSDKDKTARFSHYRSKPESRRESLNQAFFDDDLDAELDKIDIFHDARNTEQPEIPKDDSPIGLGLFDHLLSSFEDAEEPQVEEKQDEPKKNQLSLSTELGLFDNLFNSDSSSGDKVQGNDENAGKVEEEKNSNSGLGLFDNLFDSDESCKVQEIVEEDKRKKKVVDSEEDMFIEDFSDSETEVNDVNQNEVILSATLARQQSEEDMFAIDEDSGDYATAQEFPKNNEEDEEQVFHGLEKVLFEDDNAKDVDFEKNGFEKRKSGLNLSFADFEDEGNALNSKYFGGVEKTKDKTPKTSFWNFDELENVDFEDEEESALKTTKPALSFHDEDDDLFDQVFQESPKTQRTLQDSVSIRMTPKRADLGSSKRMSLFSRSPGYKTQERKEKSMGISLRGKDSNEFNEGESPSRSKGKNGLTQIPSFNIDIENDCPKEKSLRGKASNEFDECGSPSSRSKGKNGLTQIPSFNSDIENDCPKEKSLRGKSSNEFDESKSPSLHSKTKTGLPRIPSFNIDMENDGPKEKSMVFSLWGKSSNEFDEGKSPSVHFKGKIGLPRIPSFNSDTENQALNDTPKEKSMLSLRGKAFNEFKSPLSHSKTTKLSQILSFINSPSRKTISQIWNHQVPQPKTKSRPSIPPSFNCDMEIEGPSRKVIPQIRKQKFHQPKTKSRASSNSDTDDDFVAPAQKSKTKGQSQSRVSKKPEQQVEKFQTSSKVKNRSRKMEKRKKSGFVIDEAEVSSDANTSGGDSEESGDMDRDLEGFVSHTQHVEGDEMRAHYMRTVQSPKFGNFHFRPLKHVPRELIYSQYVPPDREDYQNDSFCVDENEEESFLDATHLENMEKKLKRKQRKKKARRKNVSSASGSEDSEDEFLVKRTRKHSTSSDDEIEKMRKQLPMSP